LMPKSQKFPLKFHRVFLPPRLQKKTGWEREQT